MARMELQGMQELIDKVNKLGGHGVEIKKKALNKAGVLVKAAMERNAPRSELTKRHMADNITVSNIKRKNGTDYVEIGPTKGNTSEFFYSKFTEWGTSKIPAQHWAGISVLENKREIKGIISEELRKGIEE